jgi:hypothetical protein
VVSLAPGDCRRPRRKLGTGGTLGGGFPTRRFRTSPDRAAPAVRGELAIGWVFHYVVGIVYAALYLVIAGAPASTPSLLSALVFAWVLLIAPWFLMQPALGLGFMAARTPKPAAVRVLNISVHTWFGIGLYLGALAWLAMS